MSNEAHLAENAITAYKRNKARYHEGFKEFNIEQNREIAEVVFGNSDNMESIYEIIIEAFLYRY